MRNGRPQVPVTQGGLIGTTLLCTLLGTSVFACKHSSAVQELADEAAEVRKETIPEDGQTPVAKGPYRTQGKDPNEALKTSEMVLTSAAPATPVVDEEGRNSCEDDPVRDLYIPDAAVQAQTAEIVSKMTIDQKVIELTGVVPDYNDTNRWEDIQRSRDQPELNLRGYQWRDGPHGLNLEAGQGRDPLENYSTSFPVSVAQGATFNYELMRKVGEAMGNETVAAGNSVLLTPCMNLLRHPRWGRSQETFGEDTYHLGRMATAITVGLQERVTGCAKHWLGNNIDNQRFSINANMDEQTLREVYGRHFEMVVRDGGIGCVMASYNSVNGVKQTQNKHTLTTVLREDFGFRGFVLTDWWAMPGQKNGQGPVDPPADAVNAAEALNAGLDVEVPWTVNFDAIPTIVGNGTLNAGVVDTAVKRVLEQKIRFKSAFLDTPIGLKPPTVGYDAVKGSITGSEAHADLARQTAEEAMVLLKNEGGVLPIQGVTKVAVIGATVDYTVNSDRPKQKKFNFLTDAALGDRGSSRVRPNPALTVGPLAGITANAPQGVTIVSGASAADVGDAEFVVVIVGLTAGDEGEEYTGASDRENLDLPAVHNDLINSIVALNKPMVVINQSGGAVNMPWLAQVDAAVMAWYPGQVAGEAMGRLLFGKANFSGRLPITWPMTESQFPPFNEGESTNMDYFAGYRHFDQNNLQPLFPFGHGLSYSKFSYERIHVPCGDVTTDGLINVEVDVRNVEGPAGDEVVLLFASYPETAARRSKKELKGFARVRLEPGQAKRVTIPLRAQELKYWDMAQNKWIVEKGRVDLHVGPSSVGFPLTQSITVK